MVTNSVVSIGAIVLAIVGNPNCEFILQDSFRDFFTTDLPQVSYKVSIDPTPNEPSQAPIFDSEIMWRLYYQDDRWLVWVGIYGQPPYLVGNFSKDYSSGEIYISESSAQPGKYVFPLAYPMGELIMVNLLGMGYGLMLHSCGVVDQGDGFVFAGIGGAGKSTTSRLWYGLPSVQVINDDHTILRKLNGQFRVFGTPWHGQGGHALATDAPIKRLFILKHAEKNMARRLSPAQASAQLLVRIFAPHWSASAMAFTLQFLDELCQEIPCYELGFVPDQSAVDYVRHILTE